MKINMKYEMKHVLLIISFIKIAIANFCLPHTLNKCLRMNVSKIFCVPDSRRHISVSTTPG